MVVKVKTNCDVSFLIWVKPAKTDFCSGSSSKLSDGGNCRSLSNYRQHFNKQKFISLANHQLHFFHPLSTIKQQAVVVR